MKALTIAQPYSELIVRGLKRVENRNWPAPQAVIGQRIAIHAGKSKAWLSGDNYGIPVSEMQFGKIVATAKVAMCVGIFAAWRGPPDLQEAFKKIGWSFEAFQDHEHTEGPFCWVLSEVQPLTTPIPYTGAQRLWLLPDHVIKDGAQP